MIIVGLTGSIGMGKSTTAAMFAGEGVPVNSADDIVHELYRNEAAPLIEKAFPGTTENGVVDREKLSARLLADPSGYKRLEAIVHPLVRLKERQFVEHHARAGAPVVVLDIPLLFETGADKRVDRIVVVSCDPEIQRARVLARPGMTEAKFASILARQTPDAEKRARADFVVDSGRGLEAARAAVRAILDSLRDETKGTGTDA